MLLSPKVYKLKNSDKIYIPSLKYCLSCHVFKIVDKCSLKRCLANYSFPSEIKSSTVTQGGSLIINAAQPIILSLPPSHAS